MKILTIYDGTIQSKIVLRYGLGKAKEINGELLVLQIFQSSLFVDYDAGPRAEELARTEAARHLRDAEALIHDANSKGITVRILFLEGDPVEEALHVAEVEHADLILSTPRYKGLVNKASCPVHLMPGTILVPVDSSDSVLTETEKILAEAKATGSKVLLLGIVPTHLYSAVEKIELEQVGRETNETLIKIKNALSKENIEILEITRSGYPDEEILKAAEEYSVSLIMLPAGGKTPSELTKAASILLEEPNQVRPPIQIILQAGS
jgi:nucleotide-binding universal stress UspA family protein